MIALNVKEKNYEAPKLREHFVEFLKISLAIKPLQFIYKRKSERMLNELKTLPDGTIGADLYKMLNNNGLKVIPKFENHDLKHIILGYGMTSIEEIKMQAYLFGNGNKSISCVLFLASGFIFPEKWSSFYQEYKKGKKSACIHHISFEETIIKQTELVKATYCSEN